MVKNETLYTLLVNNDLDSLKKALEDNIREESVKGNKKAKSQLSILKKLFKVRKGTTPRDFVDKAIQIDENLYGFMDSHHFFISNNDFGYEIINKGDAGYFDLSNIINAIVDNCYSIEFSENDIANLKLKIQQNKTLPKYANPIPFVIRVYGYDDVTVGFNPQYLLDALEFSGTNKIAIKDYKTPCYIMSDEGNGAVILPINVRDCDYTIDKDI